MNAAAPIDTPKLQAPKFEAPKIEAPKVETPKIEPPKVATPQPLPTPPAKPIATRFETGNLGGKKTSPTLVEFQTKKATVPEWRLQLQNSVRQKAGTNRRGEAVHDEQQTTQPRSTSGANALKVEYVEDEQPQHQNPRVANALKRIEESRRIFSNQPVAEQRVNIGGKQPATRNYPFNVVARSSEPPKPRAGQKATVNASPKPMLVSSLKIEKKKYDTNKLPPLAKPARHIEAPLFDELPTVKDAEAARERWETLNVDEVVVENVEPNIDPDEIEDLAPFSMRFAAVGVRPYRRCFCDLYSALTLHFVGRRLVDGIGRPSGAGVRRDRDVPLPNDLDRLRGTQPGHEAILAGTGRYRGKRIPDSPPGSGKLRGLPALARSWRARIPDGLLQRRTPGSP
jgi:hypothetical protein